MTPELETAIHALCDSLSQLWSIDLFKGDSPLYREGSEKAITEVEETAKRLPITGRVIRGLTGVKVVFSEKSDLSDSISNLLNSSSKEPKSYHHEKLQGALAEVQKNISNFSEIVLSQDSLIYCLLKESIGLKIGSFSDFIEWKKVWGTNLLIIVIFISFLFQRYLWNNSK